MGPYSTNFTLLISKMAVSFSKIERNFLYRLYLLDFIVLGWLAKLVMPNNPTFRHPVKLKF